MRAFYPWHATILFVAACLWAVAAAAADTSVLAARRYETDDGWVAARVYAGHVHHPLGLWVRWPSSGGGGGGAWNDSEVLLAPADKLLAGAASAGTTSPLDDAWLTLQARHERRAYRVGALQPPASALPPEAASGQARGLLNLAWPNSTLWGRVAAVGYTGSRLLLRSTDAKAAEAAGHGAAAGTRRLDLPASGSAALGAARVDAVTLHWDPAAALTHVPPALLIEAQRLAAGGSGSWQLVVTLDDGAPLVLADASDLEPRGAPRLAAGAADEVRIGRRLAVARGLAVAFEARRPPTGVALSRASGPAASLYTVWWATTLPDGVRDVAALGGLVVLFMVGYAAAHLLAHLRLLPSAIWQDGAWVGTAPAPPPTAAQWRLVRHAWILLVLGTALHVLAALFAGRGAVVDASLGRPLAALATALGAGSVPLALVLGAATVRAVRHDARLSPTDQWRGVAFAGAHSVLLMRSLAAAVLVGAGVSMVGMAALAVVWLGMVFFTNAYVALLLLVAVLARPRAPGRAWPARLAAYAQVALHAALVALDAAAAALWLLAPALDATNALYAPRVLSGAVVWLLVAPALAAVALVARETAALAEARLPDKTADEQ